MAKSDKKVTIRIRKSTLDQLKQYAEPLEDTVDTVIGKILEKIALLSSGSKGRCSQAERDRGSDEIIKVRDPFQPPNLKHTKVLNSFVDEFEIEEPTWKTVRDSVIEFAFDQGDYDLQRLRRDCPVVNVIEGARDDSGFEFLEQLGISIQGQDAEHSWQAAASLAKKLNIALHVTFHWRHKQGAAYPGKKGRLTVNC